MFEVLIEFISSIYQYYQVLNYWLQPFHGLNASPCYGNSQWVHKENNDIFTVLCVYASKKKTVYLGNDDYLKLNLELLNFYTFHVNLVSYKSIFGFELDFVKL